MPVGNLLACKPEGPLGTRSPEGRFVSEAQLLNDKYHNLPGPFFLLTVSMRRGTQRITPSCRIKWERQPTVRQTDGSRGGKFRRPMWIRQRGESLSSRLS